MAQVLVNTASGTSDGSATTLAATAASHTTGNALYVAVVWSGNVNANIPTDTAGNTYVSTGQKASNGTSDHTEIFYAENITGNASNIVTAHFASAATFRRVMVHQVSGSATSGSFTTGQGGTAVALAAASVTTSNWTTSGANAYLFAGMGSSGSTTDANVVAGTSYAKELHNIGTDSGTEDRIVSSTGTYTASYTSSASSQDWWLAAASFIASGGGSNKAITPTSNISATSTVSGNVQAQKHITAAQVSATSTVAGNVQALKHITPAQIAATSTVSGKVQALKFVPPAQISAFSTVTAAIRAFKHITTSTIAATSTVTLNQPLLPGGATTFFYDQGPQIHHVLSYQ